MVLPLCRRVRRVADLWPQHSAGHFGLPAAGAEDVPQWLYWTAELVYFVPGAIVGRRARLAAHPSGERRAGLVFPRLQRGFRRHHVGLRLERRPAAAGQRGGAACLRRIAGADDLRDARRAHGFHPATRPGAAALERAVARFLFAGADQGGRRQDREDHPAHRGRRRHGLDERQCRSCCRRTARISPPGSSF